MVAAGRTIDLALLSGAAEYLSIYLSIYNIHDVLILMDLQGSLRHGRTVLGEGAMVAAEYLSIYISLSIMISIISMMY